MFYSAQKIFYSAREIFYTAKEKFYSAQQKFLAALQNSFAGLQRFLADLQNIFAALQMFLAGLQNLFADLQKFFATQLFVRADQLLPSSGQFREAIDWQNIPITRWIQSTDRCDSLTQSLIAGFVRFGSEAAPAMDRIPGARKSFRFSCFPYSPCVLTFPHGLTPRPVAHRIYPRAEAGIEGRAVRAHRPVVR